MRQEPIDTEDDPRLMQIARDYLAELEAGHAPDRRVYLTRHPELAAELEQCLDGIELAHGVGRALHSPPDPAPDFPAGTLGDFQIVREIGRGGMGVVYEAVQLSLKRPVALKVLPFASGLDARQLQRFKTEAHAAAGLHHTNIVPVHAVGCERGVHFYAMQLIEGRPLDVVIQSMRGDSVTRVPTGATTTEFRAGPTSAVVTNRTMQRSTRDRERFRTAAKIAAQVADALEYAHTAGVIHRDIKPANLLLDASGTVWVTDFGLAHVSDGSLTRTGDVVGTLRYMSPEQAAGRRVLVDHRADIYSLGATLYELLTLQPIFDAADRGALLNQILNEEPRPPRQIDRTIPGELETIVLKATAKAPEDRYTTAADLAADLRRYLDERPILARRPSLAERLRKWLRRHPSFVAAALMLLTFSTIVLAVAVALVGREQARAERAYAAELESSKEAKAAYAAERQRAREAEERFHLAERAVDDLVQVAQEELRDRPDAENLRKQLMEMALAYHQEFIELHRDDPGAQARLAENRDRVEAILTDLIDKEGARRADLLKERAVLDDLKFTAAEREAVDKLNDRLRLMRETAFKEFYRLPADERERRFLRLARSIDAAVSEVLTTEQMRRLRQIELQRQGPEAFRRPEVATALKLTTAQRTRIRSLIADPFAGKAELPGPPDKKRKAALTQITAVLTAEQETKWKEVIGEPFKGPIPPPFKHGRPKGPMR